MYPTAEHLELALKSNSIWPDDAAKQDLARFQAAIAAQGAADQWEKLTGWSPFVAGSISTRAFDLPDFDGFLNLRGGALSIESVTLRGRVLTAGRDYLPLPRAAVQRGEAITGIQFRSLYSGHNNWAFGDGAEYPVLEISARWGRVAECPGDVFLALQKRAIATMMDLIENQQSIASISQDGFNKQYDIVGVRTQKDIAETGDKDFIKIVEAWKRVAI
ncbi:hypothetical protein EON83_28410 [bacterium]|nr:MAG: hypothetical protein EON83_28410 [bacterium]